MYIYRYMYIQCIQYIYIKRWFSVHLNASLKIWGLGLISFKIACRRALLVKGVMGFCVLRICALYGS